MTSAGTLSGGKYIRLETCSTFAGTLALMDAKTSPWRMPIPKVPLPPIEFPHRYTQFALMRYCPITHFTVSITRFSVGPTSGPL